MTHFIDGPAAGQTLMLKRAPLYLRVVEKNGAWDALDQLEDTPDPAEKIYAYERVGKPGQVHINQGSGRGGWFTMAEYSLVADQPGDVVMRDPESWRKWCIDVERNGA